jgi:DNA-binding MarR family transcriptional regulator
MSAAKDRLRLWLRLLKLSRFVETELRERFRSEFSSTLPRFDVMAALSRAPEGLKMSRLSAVLRVSNGNVTGIIDRLVEDGFVERVPVAGDRRAMLVRLTDTGAAEFARQADAHEGWVNGLLAEMTAQDARMIARQLADVMEEKELAHAL